MCDSVFSVNKVYLNTIASYWPAMQIFLAHKSVCGIIIPESICRIWCGYFCLLVDLIEMDHSFNFRRSFHPSIRYVVIYFISVYFHLYMSWTLTKNQWQYWMVILSTRKTETRILIRGVVLEVCSAVQDSSLRKIFSSVS